MRSRVKDKGPLYRKVNTRARGVHHRFGGDYRAERRTGAARQTRGTCGSMRGRSQRGLDYTPLYKYLLSKVGEEWDLVYGEAVSRLDRPDPEIRARGISTTCASHLVEIEWTPCT